MLMIFFFFSFAMLMMIRVDFVTPKINVISLSLSLFM